MIADNYSPTPEELWEEIQEDERLARIAMFDSDKYLTKAEPSIFEATKGYSFLNREPRRVYVMSMVQEGKFPIPGNIIKVGVSKNPTERAAWLTKSYKHLNIRFDVVFESSFIMNPGNVEREIHLALARADMRYLDPRLKRGKLDGYSELFYNREDTNDIIEHAYNKLKIEMELEFKGFKQTNKGGNNAK